MKMTTTWRFANTIISPETGGTYTQGGLWKAYGEFPTGDATQTTTGIQRKPIVVLMTDGAPTIANAETSFWCR